MGRVLYMWVVLCGCVEFGFGCGLVVYINRVVIHVYGLHLLGVRYIHSEMVTFIGLDILRGRSMVSSILCSWVKE